MLVGKEVMRGESSGKERRNRQKKKTVKEKEV